MQSSSQIIVVYIFASLFNKSKRNFSTYSTKTLPGSDSEYLSRGLDHNAAKFTFYRYTTLLLAQTGA